MHRGRCLCGKVTFKVKGDLPTPSACHCSMCRRHTGHFLAATEVAKSALTISGEEHVKWFHSSKKARRGFCSECGSTLFFDPLYHDWIGISMGAFDQPTETRLSLHIFTADQGDYYDIADGLPQNPE